MASDGIRHVVVMGGGSAGWLTAGDGVARLFNDQMRYRWDRIIDFLKLHYLLSGRQSAYWVDNRAPETVPESLAGLMALWDHQPPSAHHFPRAAEIFPAASYQYVLYGMGFPAPARPTVGRRAAPDLADRMLTDGAGARDRFLAGLPDTRHLLDHIAEAGLPRV